LNRISKFLLYGTAIFAGTASTATVTEAADVPVCYDAIVSARLIKLVPSEIPDCGENCIVMVWPWFADLKIERVLKGRVPTPRLSVLTMLHSYLVPSSFTWSLRRNKEGGSTPSRTRTRMQHAVQATLSQPNRTFAPAPDKL
jgi:hypothetical protein